MKTINYENRLMKIPKYEKGGGTTNVEPPIGLSIEDMYKRMLMLGEVSTATKLKSNNHGSIERADKLIKAATEAPQYMRDGDRFKKINELADLNDKIKADNKKRQEESLINLKVNARLEHEKEKALSKANNIIEGNNE